MHRTPCALIIAWLVALGLAAPGTALHCNGEITTIGTGPAILYVDDRSAQAGPINHWFYLESNGKEGLQSGESMCLDCGPLDFTDPCHHPDPDKLII